jgi:hypothetical protein
VSNDLHLERLLQVCQECNKLHKGLLPLLTGGPQKLTLSSRRSRREFTTCVSFSRDIGDARRQHTSPFVETKEVHVHKKHLLSSRRRRHTYTVHVSFRRDRGDTGSLPESHLPCSGNALWKYFTRRRCRVHVTSLVSVFITKGPYGPKETTI